MDVPDNEVVGEGAHGICQDVPADGLHDVLHELWAVALDPAPFLLGIDSHVGDRLSSEFVLTDLRLHVGQAPTGGKLDEEHA